MIYLNENNPHAAQWLRNLIAKGYLPDGQVDARSIVDVRPSELDYDQCHFFAGIGGWPRALDLAGWGNRPVWTASLPCQPLSVAGKRKGAADERHLWPTFHALVDERRPAIIFGEQVASKAGRDWLSAVRLDLEDLGYAVAAACLPACGVGAPHRRYRMFWLAHRDDAGRQGRLSGRADKGGQDLDRHVGRYGAAGIVADAGGDGLDLQYGNLGEQAGARERRDQPADSGPWDDLVWLPCRDGKWRPTQSGLFPLAHGVSGRVGRLRSYGNAIVPQVAAAFIRSYMDI